MQLMRGLLTIVLMDYAVEGAGLPRLAKPEPNARPTKEYIGKIDNPNSSLSYAIHAGASEELPVSAGFVETLTTTAFATARVVISQADTGYAASVKFSPPTRFGGPNDISKEANSTDSVNATTTSPLASSPGSDFPYVAVLNETDTFPGNSSTVTNSDIIAVIGGEDFDQNEHTENPKSPIPTINIISNSEYVNDTAVMVENGLLEKRQTVTQNFPNSDTISFQAHAPEGFIQPQIRPVFQQVVDTTSTTTSTTTTDVSTTVASGTTTTTTTTSESVTETITSTSTSWDSMTTTWELCTAVTGIEYITEWSTTRTCYPVETGLSALIQDLPASCADANTLCTITAAYIISIDPTTTMYSTTPVDFMLTETGVSTTTETVYSDNVVGAVPATVTETIYSDDPNGFHVYITTLSDANGVATATYLFTDPTPTASSTQTTSSILTASIEPGYSIAPIINADALFSSTYMVIVLSFFLCAFW